MVTPFKVARQAKVSSETMDLIQRRYMDPKDVWGMPYGFDKLDKATGGIHSVEDSGTNELAILGARSNVGKSSFAQTIAINLGFLFQKSYPGLQVRVISLEMDPRALYRKALGQIADVELWKLQTGKMDAEEHKRVVKADKKLSNLPITYIAGSADIDAIEKFIVAEDTKTGQKCGYFIIDHISIIPSDIANRTANHTFGLGQISRQLHHIARENCPGMVLSQLNRDSLKRKDNTPNSSDLAQSDKIFQDADVVLLLHRPDIFEEDKKGSQSEEIAYCIVEKNRDGAVGMKLPMSFNPRLALWSDLPEEEEFNEPV